MSLHSRVFKGVYDSGQARKKRFARNDEDQGKRYDVSSFPWKLEEATWDLTYACNLRCKHCVTSSGQKKDNELNTEQALQVIDILIGAGIRSLILSGGEPLLRPDINILLEYFWKKGLKPGIVTNGVDIPVKTLKNLKKYGVERVQVSIDGMGKDHDISRGKKGAFNKACDTISFIKNAGVPVSVGTTVTPKNIGTLGDIIDLAIKLGCHEFRAIPFLPAGRGKENSKLLKLNNKDSRYISLFMSKKKKELEGVINIAMDGCFTEILKPPPLVNYPDGLMVCSAGTRSISITADGTVYPCTYLIDFPAGNLLEKSLKEIWECSPVFAKFRELHKSGMMEPCKSCDYAPVMCNGGCRASAYLENNDLTGPDPLCFRYLDRSEIWIKA